MTTAHTHPATRRGSRSRRRGRLCLDEAVVLLTGATGGLGSDLARELHHYGARVALAGRSEERLAALAAELDGPDHALVLRSDVAELAQLEDTAKRTVEHFGRIDVVIAGAGTDTAATLEDISPEAFERDIDTSLTAALTAAWGGYRGVFAPVERGQVVKEIVRSITRRARTTVVPRRYSAASLLPGLLQRLLEAGPLRPHVKGNPHV